jgi:hypothetical protein
MAEAWHGPVGERGDPGGGLRRPGDRQMSGRGIVQMVKDDLKPSDILTKEAFENAIRTTRAIGGSTNAGSHLLAMRTSGDRPDARRLGTAAGATCRRS